MEYAYILLLLQAKYVLVHEFVMLYLQHKPFGKWKRTFLRNEHTKIMYDYHCKGKHKSFNVNCEKLMKHERVHKKGGGGKISPTQIVTDYECAKIPLHDFRRSMYVQYN